MKGIVTVVGKGANVAAITDDRNNKQVIFKNCAPFTDCKSEINNIKVDNIKDLDIVIERNYNYAKISGTL